MTQVSFFKQFPDDIVPNITKYLLPAELNRLAVTCKALHNLIFPSFTSYNDFLSFRKDFAQIVTSQEFLYPSHRTTASPFSNTATTPTWACSDITRLDPNVSKIVTFEFIKSHLTSLTELDIVGATLTSEVAASIINSLPLLTSINLRNNYLDDSLFEGIPVISRQNLQQLTRTQSCNSLSQCILDPSKLTQLDLSYNPHITKKVFSSFLVRAKNIQLLYLDSNSKIVDDEFLAHMSRCLQHICDLRIPDCNRVSDAGLRALSNTHTLTRLDMSFCNGITDKGIATVVRCQNKIVDLAIASTAASNDTLKALKVHTKTLSMLNISGCKLLKERRWTFFQKRISEETRALLSSCENMSQLFLDSLKAGNDDVEEITKGMKNLTLLSMKNGSTSKAVIPALELCTNLRELRLDSSHSSDQKISEYGKSRHVAVVFTPYGEQSDLEAIEDL